jgi:hypothetical protein
MFFEVSCSFAVTALGCVNGTRRSWAYAVVKRELDKMHSTEPHQQTGPPIPGFAIVSDRVDERPMDDDVVILHTPPQAPPPSAQVCTAGRPGHAVAASPSPSPSTLRCLYSGHSIECARAAPPCYGYCGWRGGDGCAYHVFPACTCGFEAIIGAPWCRTTTSIRGNRSSLCTGPGLHGRLGVRGHEGTPVHPPVSPLPPLGA